MHPYFNSSASTNKAQRAHREPSVYSNKDTIFNWPSRRDETFVANPQVHACLLQIIDLCRQNNKLAAIKLYRDATNLSLKESMEYVTKLEAPLHNNHNTAAVTDSPSYQAYESTDTRNLWQKIVGFITGDKA
jgi:hypothetical protein